jgi:hypothetical protein
MVMKAARTVPGARLGGTTVPHIPAAVTATARCKFRQLNSLRDKALRGIARVCGHQSWVPPVTQECPIRAP